MSNLTACILVGGPSVGTRFRPLSLDCPKPLFPIAGFPMIYHHIRAFSKVPNLKQILLIGFYEKQVFTNFIEQCKRDFPNLAIRYLQEYQSLGTAGGLYHFRDEVLANNSDLFFVAHADIASSFPFQRMLHFHRSNNPNALCTLCSVKVDKEKAQKYGCIVAEPSTHEVLHYVEKPESFFSSQISAGIYLFSTKIFDFIRTLHESRRASATNSAVCVSDDEEASDGRLRLEKDILRRLAGSKGQMYTFELDSVHDFWMQIKSADAAITANRCYLDLLVQLNEVSTERETTPMHSPTSKYMPISVLRDAGASNSLNSLNIANLEVAPKKQRLSPEIIGNVKIDPTAQVDPTARIGPNVTIGPGAIIERGVRIRDAIILDSVVIRHSACINYCVIGWSSVIGRWCRVEGNPLSGSDAGANTVQGRKVPGASILGKKVTLQDECILRSCIVLPHKDLKSSYQNEILM